MRFESSDKLCILMTGHSSVLTVELLPHLTETG